VLTTQASIQCAHSSRRQATKQACSRSVSPSNITHDRFDTSSKLTLLLQTTHQTAHGQLLDLTTAPPGTTDLSKFTVNNYMRIVTFKTAYYSFYLPVACGMLISGDTDPQAFQTAKDILLIMGQYFQVTVAFWALMQRGTIHLCSRGIYRLHTGCNISGEEVIMCSGSCTVNSISAHGSGHRFAGGCIRWSTFIPV